jgi:drug/metabolite transporter (DMT)-like permease
MNGIKISLWIFFTVLLSAGGAICVDHYLQNRKAWYWILFGIFINALMIYGYFQVFKLKSPTLSYTIIKILSVFVFFLYGYIVFKEKFSIKNYCGIVLSFVTIYLLS